MKALILTAGRGIRLGNYTDNMFEDNCGQKFKDILDNKADLFIIGEDCKGKFDYLTEYCKVECLSRTKGYTTTTTTTTTTKLEDNLKTLD